MMEPSKPTSLAQYLDLVLVRPGMYIGSSDVSDLRKHLDGWRAHRRFCPDGDTIADVFFDKFHKYVAEFYQDRRTVGWDRMIHENEGNDDLRLKRFKALFDAFLRRNDER